GELVSSEVLLGRTVVLEFWATWCPACVSSLPALNAYRDSVKDEPSISVFGVHVPKGAFAPSVSAFMERRQYSFDVILDRHADLSRAFQIDSIPTLIILGPDGRVRHVKNGAIGGSAEEGARRIEDWVAKALTDED
ncbi:MAG: TlpA family protein disulfide reductase, partial [Bradymonadia bacterium]